MTSVQTNCATVCLRTRTNSYVCCVQAAAAAAHESWVTRLKQRTSVAASVLGLSPDAPVVAKLQSPVVLCTPLRAFLEGELV